MRHPKTGSERMLAALLHLAYLPGIAGIALAIAMPQHMTIILPMCALWLMALVAGLLFEPQSAFLAEHLHEARSYHVQGFLVIAVGFLVLLASGLITWGAGSALALAALPCALLLAMGPTFKASYRALRGEHFDYDAPWERWFRGTQRSAAPSLPAHS